MKWVTRGRGPAPLPPSGYSPQSRPWRASWGEKLRFPPPASEAKGPRPWRAS
jgi:hypothetical protein